MVQGCGDSTKTTRPSDYEMIKPKYIQDVPNEKLARRKNMRLGDVHMGASWGLWLVVEAITIYPVDRTLSVTSWCKTLEAPEHRRRLT